MKIDTEPFGVMNTKDIFSYIKDQSKKIIGVKNLVFISNPQIL